jgi:hypothetical protein
MYKFSILNAKYSLLASILSGIIFIALLAIVPVHTKKKSKDSILDDTIIYTKDRRRTNSLKQNTDTSFYKIPLLKERMLQKSEDTYLSGTSLAQEFSLDREFNQRSFGNKKEILNFENDQYTIFKKEKVSVAAISDSRSANTILEYKYQQKFVDQNYFQESRNATLKNVDLAYNLNSSVSANIRSSNFDTFDDRLRQFPTTSGGMTYSNKYISSGFTAGETNFTNASRFAQANFLNGNYFYRDIDNFNRDIEKQNKSIFEWQTSFTPTKNFLLQTTIFNSNKALINETNAQEGARFSLAYGLQNVILNVRFNYLSDNLMRTFTRPDFPTINNRDFAALGFTFFIDSAKKFSVYLGNSYHNIITVRTSEANNINQTSFSASIRGRTNDKYNTTFFLNFKNNYSKEFFYSNIGVFRIPINSQLNLDYATSIGLELSF